MQYGIWYDDGEMDFGWLAEEGRHGRDHRLECDTLAEAEAVAKIERSRARDVVFSVEPVEGLATEIYKRVRKLAKENKVKCLEAHISRVRAQED